MLTREKVLKLCVPIETKEAHGDNDEEGLTITGHASTNDEDRTGDIIVSDAWKKSGALDSFLKNPVILAYHDPSRPVGKATDHEIDEKGLKITARISKAAGDIVQLVKEGILSAFSVGFIIKDADFDNKSGIFIIKELELLEVSIVSIPANQNALFSVEKNFRNTEEYKEFRNQFINKSEETLMVDKVKEDKAKEQPVDIASLAAEISSMVKKDIEAETKAAEEAKRAKEEEAAKIEATATTAAERLIADLRKELVEKEESLSKVLGEVKESLKKEAESGELEKTFEAERKNKMKFVDDGQRDKFDLSDDVKDGLLYASKVLGVPVTETKTFKELVTKSGREHWNPSATGEWEDEYSTRVENALREMLVVEPLFTNIPMNTPTLNMPINPEAGDATWVHQSSFRTDIAQGDEAGTASSGAAVDHQLTEQTLIAYKLATREYIGYEEEEDSIVNLAPIIRDAVSRRMARSSDLAVLRGGGVTTSASFDPILGLEGRGANTTDVTVAGGTGWAANVTEDNIVDMRRNLGLYGLDPNALVLLVSHDYYYELMKLTNFKTVDVLGPQATILTGQVGSIFGVRVLVSQQFDNTAIGNGTVGTTLATMVRPSNFLMGSLRGITTEADRDIVNQKRVIVSSRRFAFQDIITGEGTVNLQIAT